MGTAGSAGAQRVCGRGGCCPSVGATPHAAAKPAARAAAHVQRIHGLADTVNKSRSLGSITLGRGWPRPSCGVPSSAPTGRDHGPRQATPGQASGATIVRAEGRAFGEGGKKGHAPTSPCSREEAGAAPPPREVTQTIPGAIPSAHVRPRPRFAAVHRTLCRPNPLPAPHAKSRDPPSAPAVPSRPVPSSPPAHRGPPDASPDYFPYRLYRRAGKVTVFISRTKVT